MIGLIKEWVAENISFLFLVFAIIGFLWFFLWLMYNQIQESTARKDWCYDQGYFEVAGTRTNKFICVDLRKEKDPTLVIPTSVWEGE